MNIFPIKISPCPIVEATIELRFKTSLPKGAVFGVIFNQVKDTFGDVEQLPTAMLPLEMIENDPSFKYKALYKITDGTFTAQIGYDVIAFHCPNQYAGWEVFSKNLIIFFDKIRKLEESIHPESLLLRYLNFFELDIFQHLNLNIELLNQPIKSKNLIIRTEIEAGDFLKILQLANNVNITSNSSQKQGSLIDITCAYNTGENLFNDIENILNQAHTLEKELFFGLLKPDFLTTLNPEYSNE